MQLTAAASRTSTDLASRVFPILDARLRRDTDAPLAVALSGGGDSLALALLAADWAREAGRRLLLVTVDHGLRRESRAWAQACAATAERLGAGFEALTWEGVKPATGLAAAARDARHALLAEAARRAGARVILMGHTGSDVLEAQAMRAMGATTPDPKEWGPSPAWPEGRGLFLLRPLLPLTRSAVREWLAAGDESWIDDPANADPKSVRVQARDLTRDEPAVEPPQAEVLALAEACRLDAAAGIHVPRIKLRTAPSADAQRLLAMAAVCAGGGDQRPGSAKLDRLLRLLAGTEPVVATLAGARIEADPHDVALYREPGEAKRGGLTFLYLTPGQPLVWDGRFEVTAARPGLYVQRLGGVTRKLSAEAQRALNGLPAGARGGLPAIVTADTVACPLLEEVEGVTIETLVGERLWAAAGLVEREPA